jgi:hypothetical protein
MGGRVGMVVATFWHCEDKKKPDPKYPQVTFDFQFHPVSLKGDHIDRR